MPEGRIIIYFDSPAGYAKERLESDEEEILFWGGSLCPDGHFG